MQFFDQAFQILIFYFEYIIRNSVNVNQLQSLLFFLNFGQQLFILPILTFLRYIAIDATKFEMQ
jgi:hypothetical protein